MDEKITIILFDEEELTKTLIETYLKEITFPYDVIKFGAFDKDLIPKNDNKKIIIVNVNKTNVKLLDDISEIASDKNNNFILISYDKSTDLQVKSLRSGARDFLIKPLIQTDFIYSLTKIYKKYILKNGSNSEPLVASVVSLFEQVGKTFFSFNLAKELADLTKEKVLLVDFNNNLNDIFTNLQMNSPYNTPYYVNKLTKENAELLLSKVNKYKKSSLYIMGNGIFRNEVTVVDDRKIPEFIKILKQYYSFIILDTSDPYSNTTIDLVKESNKNYLLLEPLLTMADKTKTYIQRYYRNRSYRIILNKYNASKDENLLVEIEKKIGKQVFGKVPKNVVLTSAAIDKGVSIKELNSKADVVKFYMKLASYIVNRDRQ